MTVFFLHIEPDIILTGGVIMINHFLVLTEMQGVRLEIGLWKNEKFQLKKIPTALLSVDVKYAEKISIKNSGPFFI